MFNEKMRALACVILIMLFSLTACGGGSEDGPESTYSPIETMDLNGTWDYTMETNLVGCDKIETGNFVWTYTNGSYDLTVNVDNALGINNCEWDGSGSIVDVGYFSDRELTPQEVLDGMNDFEPSSNVGTVFKSVVFDSSSQMTFQAQNNRTQLTYVLTRASSNSVRRIDDINGTWQYTYSIYECDKVETGTIFLNYLDEQDTSGRGIYTALTSTDAAVSATYCSYIHEFDFADVKRGVGPDTIPDYFTVFMNRLDFFGIRGIEFSEGKFITKNKITFEVSVPSQAKYGTFEMVRVGLPDPNYLDEFDIAYDNFTYELDKGCSTVEKGIVSFSRSYNTRLHFITADKINDLCQAVGYADYSYYNETGFSFSYLSPMDLIDLFNDADGFKNMDMRFTGVNILDNNRLIFSTLYNGWFYTLKLSRGGTVPTP